MTVAVPACFAVRTPSADTSTTLLSLLLQVKAEDVPEGVQADSGALSPTRIESWLLDSVTLDGALTTLTLTFAFRPLWVATVIVAVPAFFAVTTPLEDTVATLGLLLENAYAAASPSPTDGVSGYVSLTPSVRASRPRVTLVGALPASTVTVQEALLPLKAVARTLAVPGDTPVKAPESSTATTSALPLVQVIWEALPEDSVAFNLADSPTHSTPFEAESFTFEGALTTLTVHFTFAPL